jgi:hypothetical protein
MTKYKTPIDESYDFGFSILDEAELKAAELALIQSKDQEALRLKALADAEAAGRREDRDHIEAEYYDKLVELRKMIMPLLKSLQKSPEKSYIFWPDRVGKLQIFIDRINKHVDEA